VGFVGRGAMATGFCFVLLLVAVWLRRFAFTSIVVVGQLVALCVGLVCLCVI
jgi:hypothetical protein